MARQRPKAAPGYHAHPGSSGGEWLELSVEADSEAVEAVSEILSRVAPGGTSVEPGFELVEDGLGARIDPTRPATIRAHVPARDPAATQRAIDIVSEALGHLQAFGLRPIGELRTKLVAESDWAEAWKEHFHVLRVGRRLVIKPSWRRHARSGDEVVIDLDPGMAFGTGLHPTTRLCLLALDAYAEDAALGRVLDVGCGSGILSIAAVKLGATRAVGVDIDPIAVEATVANARHNRVGKRVRARDGSIPSEEGPFDTVLANLIAGVLIEHAGNLADELIPGGTLIASGIFIDREQHVRGALEAAGFRITKRYDETDWVALVAARGA
ncbi:MAG TPA: 50S ribosomal protein L11 methyltransferase [Candidatus Dormibacteraeota bacterium]|nr:50S ribosomal protein L11 methyltransferase [Candidatus Dormibacteraeota bacterium]